MKKINTIISLLLLVLAMSCDSKDYIESTTSSSLKEEKELLRIYEQIDSIKIAYSNNSRPHKGFFSWFASNKIETSADNIGRVAGAYAGKYLGTAAGSLTGNPIVAVGGYIGGRKLGSMVGSVAASYAVFVGASWIEKKISKSPTQIQNYACNKIKKSSGVPTRNELTFGELHNQIIYKLISNGNKYINYINNEQCINYNLLIADAERFAKELDPNRFKDHSISDYYDEIRRQVVEIHTTSNYIYSNRIIEKSVFYDNAFSRLYNITKIDKIIYDQSAKIDIEVSETYAYLDEHLLLECKNDIDRVINEAQVNDVLRQELLLTNDVIANSTLLWRDIHQENIQ